MSKSKSKQRLSVQEFQTWLQGIMEFQSPEWSPNAEQWAAIFDKIMNLKNEDSVSTSNISAASLRKIEECIEDKLRNFNFAPSVGGQNNLSTQAHRPRGLFDEEPPQEQQAPTHPNGLKPGQELISAEEFQQLTPEELKAKLEAAKEGLGSHVAHKPQHKTPNIDSTTGYKSSFV